jgi:chitinase
MIQGDFLSDLIVAFARIDPADGSSVFMPDAAPQADGSPGFTALWDEVKAVKAKFPRLKVTVSVGGWEADGFSDMAKDETLRKTFVANVCSLLKDKDLDGVDLDWEYPVGPEWGAPIKTSPEDREYYITLLRDLRAGLDTLGAETGKTYGLSAAIPASGWFIAANDAAGAAEIVDSLKLMAYDYSGGWNSAAAHAAHFSANPADPAGGLGTRQIVDLYLSAGVPAEKLLVGVPFYGHAWAGVQDGGVHGLYQPSSSIPFGDGILSYTQIKELLKPDSGYARYWDETAQAAFLYNGDIWISYTDEEAIRALTGYVRETGLGGLFAWEYAHDKDGDLLKVLAESLQQ